MPINHTRIVVIFLISFTGCSVKKTESVMPFYNFGYTASRLQPTALSETDVAFRIWINNGTSIDRIISVSKDSVFGSESYLDEIGTISNKRKHQFFYKKTKLLPKSGIDTFITKLDSMNISKVESQQDKDFPIRVDQPFSSYVVEYKRFGKYHCFKFFTQYPYKDEVDTKYTRIEKLIKDEFKFKFYFK